MKKRIIILRQNGGRLGNQLLLFASIYAFCLEYEFECINYSFYNYKNYFQLPSDKFSVFLNLIANLKLYNSHSLHLIVYQIYKFFTYIFTFFNKGLILKEDPRRLFYLPPSIDKIKSHSNIIKKIISSKDKIIYIDGWHFRNPIGMKKYHKKIVNYIKPKNEIVKSVQLFINPLKIKYYLVGVHIRQGDYKRIEQGKWYFTNKEVAEILKNYLKNERHSSKPILFIICSDEIINMKEFKGLNIKLGSGIIIEDLFTLASCNLIIGSNSTFGSFASYYGNIPFIEFKK